MWCINRARHTNNRKPTAIHDLKKTNTTCIVSVIAIHDLKTKKIQHAYYKVYVSFICRYFCVFITIRKTSCCWIGRSSYKVSFTWCVIAWTRDSSSCLICTWFVHHKERTPIPEGLYPAERMRSPIFISGIPWRNVHPIRPVQQSGSPSRLNCTVPHSRETRFYLYHGVYLGVLNKGNNSDEINKSW